MTLTKAEEKLRGLNFERITAFINAQKNPKPIVFFDIETAAEKPEDCVNPEKAKIVSLSVIKINMDSSTILKHKVVNPGLLMCDEVMEIHGISNEEAAKQPPFSAYAKGFAAFIDGCDFAGFSSNRFDKPILARELQDAGIAWEPIFAQAQFLDVSNIYRHFNRRSLRDAVMRYLQEIMDDAHSSEFDSIYTMQVFEAMMWEHETELPKAIEDMAKILMDYTPVDLFGKVAYNKDGVIVFTFGKHKDKSVESVLGPGGEDVNYYQWMCGANFHKLTLKVVSDLRNSYRSPSPAPR